MEDLLDRFFEKLEASKKVPPKFLPRKFHRYIVKVSQVKGSFYVLIKKPRGKILNDDLNNLFNDVKKYQQEYIINLQRTLACFATTFFLILSC